MVDYSQYTKMIPVATEAGISTFIPELLGGGLFAAEAGILGSVLPIAAPVIAAGMIGSSLYNSIMQYDQEEPEVSSLADEVL